jgi:hypothetical protein
MYGAVHLLNQMFGQRSYIFIQIKYVSIVMTNKTVMNVVTST